MDIEEIMEDQETPEIVGLTRWQFFFLFASLILFGAGTCAIGYALHLTSTKNWLQKVEKGMTNLGLSMNQDSVDSSIENTQGNIPGANYLSYDANVNTNLLDNVENKVSKYYAIFGYFINEIEAQEITEKLLKFGKKAMIKKNALYYIVYLGPFETFTLAQTELESVSCDFSASIMQELPE